MAKIWHLLAHDAQAIERLAHGLRLSPIVAQLLLNRQISDPEEAKRFLAAPLTGLHEPELLPGMEEAVDRLLAAVRDQRRICVYGDYDVDGVTGTAILLTCLTLLGGNVEFHVPHRIEDGYGLNSDTLKTLAERGVKIIVTVDCGIASLAEAEEARRLGLELLITDHHEPKGGLPRADVLIHPRIPFGSNGSARQYPFGGLCGSGVAFKLAWALCKKHCGSPKVTPQLRDFLLDAIALAAMGTVADVVPLFDENRIFVRHGLARMRQQPTLGLQALVMRACRNWKAKPRSCPAMLVIPWRRASMPPAAWAPLGSPSSFSRRLLRSEPPSWLIIWNTRTTTVNSWSGRISPGSPQRRRAIPPTCRPLF